jgi:hypothetical protein
MRRALLKVLSAAMFWVPAPQLVKVTVSDAQHKVTKTITSDADLVAFHAHWARKTELPRGTTATYEYYIDLQHVRGSKRSSIRWLYGPDGMAKVLAIPFFGIHIPVYRIAAPDELNRLLGIVAT